MIYINPGSQVDLVEVKLGRECAIVGLVPTWQMMQCSSVMDSRLVG